MNIFSKDISYDFKRARIGVLLVAFVYPAWYELFKRLHPDLLITSATRYQIVFFLSALAALSTFYIFARKPSDVIQSYLANTLCLALNIVPLTTYQLTPQSMSEKNFYHMGYILWFSIIAMFFTKISFRVMHFLLHAIWIFSVASNRDLIALNIFIILAASLFSFLYSSHMDEGKAQIDRFKAERMVLLEGLVGWLTESQRHIFLEDSRNQKIFILRRNRDDVVEIIDDKTSKYAWLAKSEFIRYDIDSSLRVYINASIGETIPFKIDLPLYQPHGVSIKRFIR